MGNLYFITSSVLKDMVRDLEQMKENEEKQIQMAVDADGVTVVTTTTTVKDANGKTATTTTSSVSGTDASSSGGGGVGGVSNASSLQMFAQTVTSSACAENGGHQCKCVWNVYDACDVFRFRFVITSKSQCLEK